MKEKKKTLKEISSLQDLEMDNLIHKKVNHIKNHKCNSRCHWYSQCQSFLEESDKKYIEKHGCSDYDKIEDNEIGIGGNDYINKLIKNGRQEFREEWDEYLKESEDD